MASIATLATNVNTALASLIGSRCSKSDMRTNLEALATGSTKYQLTVNLITDIDGSSSNVVWHAAEFIVTVHHELDLSGVKTERTYTESGMWTDQASLVSRAWWRAITGVYDVVEGPSLQDGSERVGNTVTYSYAVSLSFTG